MAHSIARLTQSGILEPRHGMLQPTDRFMAHLSMFRHAGGVTQWDLRGLVEQALATWDDDVGDHREASRQLVGFLPSPMGGPAFPTLAAFVAA